MGLASGGGGFVILRSLVTRLGIVSGLALLVVACGGGAPPARQAGQPAAAPPTVKYANIGGYLLAYECTGTGSPTVILEAGYTASGISTYGPVIVPTLARRTRVCTYDRAGDGLSDARPASVRPLTGATQARELHTLLRVIRAGPPYVLVGHSYGGMITREFAGLYPGQVAGMVLLDASSEPEVAVYDRLHAGPWIDGTVQNAPNQKINIHATVRQLERAPSLGHMPLIVVTAGILQDPWLKTVPALEGKAQTRLASLSADSIHVLDRGIGHLIPALDPRIVIAATMAVLAAAASGHRLAPCQQVFRSVPTAECLRRGQLAHQRT
jgi:pimeloyl-ACP methyl ester carboxylesterase